MNVKIKLLSESATLPTYAKEGDAAVDLYSTSVKLDEHGNIIYGTDLSIEIPAGHVGLLFPRSSVSRTSMSLANSVGVIDSGYRGEILLKYRRTNATHNSIYQQGDRVGQLIIIPYPKINFIVSEKLSTTERGDGGFGSSGS